jgi:hypothetical protein
MNDKINFKAFDDGGADQYMRETLAGHRVEPNPSLWKGISRKLLWKELIHFNFTNVTPKVWMAGSVGLLMVSTMLYFGYPYVTTENPTTASNGNITRNAFSAGSPLKKSPTGLPKNSNRKNIENSLVVHWSSQTPTLKTSTKKGFPSAQKLLASAPEIQEESNRTHLPGSATVYEESDNHHVNPSGDNGMATDEGIVRLSPFGPTLSAISPGNDTIVFISNVGTMKFVKGQAGADRFLSAGLGITPEYTIYAEPDAYSAMNFWLNGAVTYHISRFTIASGFGFGYVYDEGKYRVEYKSQDSIGYFTGVTSYTVGVNNEIIYNTKTINVYDSLQHSADYRTKNRYSYLQIPLLLGYRIFESGRVSLSFQAGPAISILLGSRKSDPVIEYPNATIIRVDNDTPSRTQTNWQIWANLYLEMRMNKTVSIYLEPSFKYYLKPMVTQENVIYKAPWTIGLGVGLQFNFGHKKTSP